MCLVWIRTVLYKFRILAERIFKDFIKCVLKTHISAIIFRSESVIRCKYSVDMATWKSCLFYKQWDWNVAFWMDYHWAHIFNFNRTMCNLETVSKKRVKMFNPFIIISGCQKFLHEIVRLWITIRWYIKSIIIHNRYKTSADIFNRISRYFGYVPASVYDWKIIAAFFII